MVTAIHMDMKIVRSNFQDKKKKSISKVFCQSGAVLR